MTGSANMLHGIPIAALSRPKKGPSPRLTPRRCSRLPQSDGCSSKGGRENNENDGYHLNSPYWDTAMAGSIPTSPIQSISSSSSPDQQQGFEQSQPHMNCESSILTAQPIEAVNNAPLSPEKSMTSLANQNSPLSSSSETKSKCSQEMDEESVPLTPRNLVMESAVGAAPASSFSANYGDDLMTLTPPVNSPPLIVSAKRNGSKMRRAYAAKRRRPKDDDNDSEKTNDEDDANNMRLPEGLTPNEMAAEYWKRCYGTSQPHDDPLTRQKPSWSARRAAPIKSCLSHSKPKRPQEKAPAQILLPESAMLLSPALTVHNRVGNHIFSTPKASPLEQEGCQAFHKCPHSKSVQFGTAQAAEYDLDAPSAKFTPLPADIVQKRFPLTNKRDEDEGEQEEIEETKENSAMLAEWDQFGGGGKRHTSKKRRSTEKKHRKHTRSDRSERRQSHSFVSPGSSRALYDPASEMDWLPTHDNQDQGGLELDDSACEISHNKSGKELEGSAISQPAAAGTSISAVVADMTNNQEEYQMTIFSQEEDPPLLPPLKPTTTIGFKCPAKLPAGTVNVWEAASTDPATLGAETYQDLSTVLLNAAQSPCCLWTTSASTSSTDGKDGEGPLEDGMPLWPRQVEAMCVDALDVLSRKIKFQGDGRVSQETLDGVPCELRGTLERVVQLEWTKLELAFCENLKRQISVAEKEIAEESTVLDSIILVPARASIRPTGQQIVDTNDALQKLEVLIAEEKERKMEWQERYHKARAQRFSVRAPFATLSYLAMRYLSPIDIAMTRERSQAIFNHILEGQETQLELDGSMDTHVVLSSTDTSAELLNFYKLMLCSPDGNMLHEGLLGLSSNGDNSSVLDEVLHLSVVLGRVDLFGLGLKKFMEECSYEVSFLPLMEQDRNHTAVVRIKLRENLKIKVLFRRSHSKSTHWSIPSKMYVEQDGLPLTEALDSMSRLTASSRSLEATSGFLQRVCEIVFQSVS